MIYLKSFKLSPFIDRNPNAYPDQVFRHMAGEVLLFARITIFYGNNGSGKSSLLNLIANKLDLQGKEKFTSYGENKYATAFLENCSYELEEGAEHFADKKEFWQQRTKPILPEHSLFLKSQDIMYEIKKVEQQQILREELLLKRVQEGVDQEELKQYAQSHELFQRLQITAFAQEKYSNGETSLQLFEQYLQPGQLYLLDEPEASLSPDNQVKLAERINELARYLDCQFIIATHSPFMLGTLDAKIYNLDAKPLRTAQWQQLENMKFYYQFFQKHKHYFE